MGLSGGRQELSADVSRLRSVVLLHRSPGTARYPSARSRRRKRPGSAWLARFPPTIGGGCDHPVGHVVTQHGERSAHARAGRSRACPRRNDLGAVGAADGRRMRRPRNPVPTHNTPHTHNRRRKKLNGETIRVAQAKHAHVVVQGERRHRSSPSAEGTDGAVRPDHEHETASSTPSSWGRASINHADARLDDRRGRRTTAQHRGGGEQHPPAPTRRRQGRRERRPASADELPRIDDGVARSRWACACRRWGPPSAGMRRSCRASGHPVRGARRLRRPRSAIPGTRC